jgi:hypothetical protein
MSDFFFHTVSAVPNAAGKYELRQFKISDGGLVDQGVQFESETPEECVGKVPPRFREVPKMLVGDAFYLTFVGAGAEQ